MSRILFDGLNLGLRHGTGVATYARGLVRAAQDLGHDVSVVYGTPFRLPRDPVLREIVFYDTRETLRIGHLDKAKRWMRRQWPGAIQADVVPATGTVIRDQLTERMPLVDRTYASTELFESAAAKFMNYGTFTPLVVDQPPDVFHATYPMPLYVKGAYNIQTVHDLVPLRLPFTTLDRKRGYFRLMKEVLRRADHIVTVSECSKRDIQDLFGIEDARITNTYQSVDARRAPAGQEPDADILATLRNFDVSFRDYFVFVGALEPKKNVLRLLEAYLGTDLPQPLLVIGAGGWSNEEVRERIADQPVPAGSPPRVRRHLYVGRRTLMNLVAGARGLLFPSLYEGFGLPVLEAMQLGTPVVTSATSSLPEVAGGGAVLVNPYDVSAITEGITTLARDDDTWARCRELGLRQAQRFSRPALMPALADLYGRSR